MKKSVLIIDDDTAILDLIRLLLEDTDCEGYTLSSVTHLLETVQRLRPNAVLVDILMRNASYGPDGNDSLIRDGWDAAARLRQVEPRVPLIMFTASSAAASEFGKTDRGRLFDAVLPKPFDIAQLNAVLDGLCEGLA